MVKSFKQDLKKAGYFILCDIICGGGLGYSEKRAVALGAISGLHQAGLLTENEIKDFADEYIIHASARENRSHSPEWIIASFEDGQRDFNALVGLKSQGEILKLIENLSVEIKATIGIA